MCDSKDDGGLACHATECASPPARSCVELCVSFSQADLTAKLPEEWTLKAPNPPKLEASKYLAADGDINIKCMAFEGSQLARGPS